MSKYYKAEDIIKAYNEAVRELVEAEMKEFDLGDFTECSFNTTQLKLIPRKIESLPTIEVSEDCISRADLLKTIDDNVSQQHSDTYETYGLDLWALFVRMVKNAPSVVPQKYESGSNDSEISEIDAVRPTDDCISREYMLRALNGYGKDWQEDCEIADVIRNAPSVVPRLDKEDLEDIYEHISESYIEGYMDGQADGVDAIGDCNLCRFAGCSECDDCINGSQWVRMTREDEGK